MFCGQYGITARHVPCAHGTCLFHENEVARSHSGDPVLTTMEGNLV